VSSRLGVRLRAIAGVTRAEALRVARDPGALLILAGAVVLYSFFYPIPYLPQVLREVPVAVVDLDRTPLSRQLARTADAHPLLRVDFRPASVDEAERLVLAGSAGGILVVPEGFERRIRLGQRARVGAYADASYFLVYRQVATGFLESTGVVSAGIDVRRLESRGRPRESALALRDPVPLLVRPLFNPAEGYASYVVPAVLVLILQQTLLIGIGLLGGTAAETRRAATTPTGPGPSVLARVLGRALFYLALYAVYCFFMFGVVYRVFDFPERSRAGDLGLFALPFLLACIFLAQAFSALFRRRETALQVLLFSSLPAVFLAGFAWPAEALPRWLRGLSLLLPSTAGIAGFLRLTEMGATLRQVRFEWLVLWALAASYFTASWLAERRAGRRRGE
jgi:ABC-2 type transport system permease protein